MKRIKTAFLRFKINVYRKLIGFCGLSTALFVFQACYGTDMGYGLYYQFEGVVMSADSLQPIPNTQVNLMNSLNDDTISAFTNQQGQYFIDFYLEQSPETFKLEANDINGGEYGEFESKDTVIESQSDTYNIDFKLLRK